MQDTVTINIKELPVMSNMSKIDDELMLMAVISSYTQYPINNMSYVKECAKIVYNKLAYTSVSADTAADSIGSLVDEKSFLTDVLCNHKIITIELLNKIRKFTTNICFDKLDQDAAVFHIVW